MPTLIKLKRSVTGNPLQPAQLNVELDEGEPFVDTYSKALVVGRKKDGSTKDKIGDHYVNDVWVDTYQPLVRSDNNPVVIGNTSSTLRIQKGENPIEGIRPIELVSDSRIVMQATGDNAIALYGESIYLCPKGKNSENYPNTIAIYDNGDYVDMLIDNAHAMRFISTYTKQVGSSPVGTGAVVLEQQGGVTIYAKDEETTGSGYLEMTLKGNNVTINNGRLVVNGEASINGTASVSQLKIGNSNIGSSLQPVYVNNGTITPCKVAYMNVVDVSGSVNIGQLEFEYILLHFMCFSDTKNSMSPERGNNLFLGGICKQSNQGYGQVIDAYYYNDDYYVMISGNTTYTKMDTVSHIVYVGSHIY